MENYKNVKKEDLVGRIEDLPIEVVQKMVDYQIEQGNVADIKVFQIKRCPPYSDGGFSWYETEEGYDFWSDVITSGNFGRFFDKYPKNKTYGSEANQEVNTHVYYRGNAERGEEIISELIKLGGINYYNISAKNIDCYYFVDPKNKRINFLPSGGLYSHILDECYTEKFLPENKQETIEIYGKKYNKQEILDRIKELKEVK